MRISDWSSDVCSSDLDTDRNRKSNAEPVTGGFGEDRPMNTASPEDRPELAPREAAVGSQRREVNRIAAIIMARDEDVVPLAIIVETEIALLLAHEPDHLRSEEHTSELQSLMRTSYAV